MFPNTSAVTPRGLFSFTCVGMQPVVALGKQDVPETNPAKFVMIPFGEILCTRLAFASVR